MRRSMRHWLFFGAARREAQPVDFAEERLPGCVSATTSGSGCEALRSFGERRLGALEMRLWRAQSCR